MRSLLPRRIHLDHFLLLKPWTRNELFTHVFLHDMLRLPLGLLLCTSETQRRARNEIFVLCSYRMFFWNNLVYFKAADDWLLARVKIYSCLHI